MCSNYQEAGTSGVTIRSSCFWPASLFSAQFSLPASYEEGGTRFPPRPLFTAPASPGGLPSFLPDPSSLLRSYFQTDCSPSSLYGGRVSPATGALWLLLLECLLPLNDKASYMYGCLACMSLYTMCALSVEYRREPQSSQNKS